MRTQVGIVGAGPAGLLLSQLLHLHGIDTVILERRSRAYVEGRIRAGVLEQGTVDLLDAAQVGERMHQVGLVHDGIELSFGGSRHRIDFKALTGKAVTIYGQTEVTKDLIGARLAAGGQIVFEAADVSIHDFDGKEPKIRFRQQGKAKVLRCDFIGGCDGFHGVCRATVSQNALTVYERMYPFAWLGILAETKPVSVELIYCHHERGFALFSMRSPTLSRLYIQCAPDEHLDEWPDERIWDELRLRVGGDAAAALRPAPSLEKSVTPMRSFVAEPMRFGRLFLAGDAAHIVPPTGAKGLNLAAADVHVLARALIEFYASGRTDLIEAYSDSCLRRIWKAQRFSWWMTSMLHRFPGRNPFEDQLQLAELDYVTGSRAASTALAENYVGLPLA
ncbi:MAG TPA: 4-hydroxybenzoate 3-monooxygenase [Geminicoccaceae bacterium]